jgi:hypothetical protein
MRPAPKPIDTTTLKPKTRPQSSVKNFHDDTEKKEALIPPEPSPPPTGGIGASGRGIE